MDFEIQQIIQELLLKSDRDFLEIMRIIRCFREEDLQKLQIHPGKDSQKGMVEKLRHCFGNSLQSYKDHRNRKFIGFNLSDEELIQNQVRKRPQISSKKLRILLPMTNARFIAALNSLLGSGKLACTSLYHTHIASGLVCNSVSPDTTQFVKQETGSKLPAGFGEKREIFRDAYQVVGKNRNYVLIHQLRDYLKWPSNFFDDVLTELSLNEEILLQGGDPSDLTKEEIAKSFMDELGYLRIAVTWRK